MKVVILAAGKGSRLGQKGPKPLTLLINGESILEHQLNLLKKYVSQDDIIIVVGFQKEKIIDQFPDLTFVYNPNFATTNTSKSLLAALKKCSEDVLWLNGDVVFHPAVLEKILNLETAVQDDEVMQDFESEPLPVGGDHSQKVKAPPTGSGYGSKDCVNSSSSTAVSRLNKPKTSMVVNVGPVGEEEVKYRQDAKGKILQVSKQVKDPQGEALGINYCTAGDLPGLRKGLERCADGDYFERGIEYCIADGMSVWAVPVASDMCTEVDFPEDLIRANHMIE